MSLPKFLLCSSFQENENEYVLHTQYPRYIALVDNNDITVIEWIDIIPPTEIDAQQLASLMTQMGDWYAIEISLS